MSTSAVRVPSVITTPLLVASVVFPIVSLISVLLRYFARRKTKAGWLIDDWFMLGTWIITLGVSVIIWASINKIGIDYLKVPPQVGARNSAACLWGLTLIMQAANSTVKISVLLFYMRIFTTRGSTIALWIGIGVVSTWAIVTLVLYSVVSDPISSSWTGGGGYRMDPVMLSIALAGSSFALDIAVLLYPIPNITKLHIPIQRKIAVGLIFALGGFCCIAAAVRLVYIKKTIALGANSKAGGFQALDKSSPTQSQTLIWCIIEPNCSMIAGSLPSYAPLFRGRVPESIIRSLRSMLSLGSGGSNRSRAWSRSNRSKVYADRGGYKASGAVKRDGITITDSEIEFNEVNTLKDSSEDSIRNWEGNGGQSVVHVDANPMPNSQASHANGIEVTRTYTTIANSQV